MKKLYPGETYDHGPLLALHELNTEIVMKDGRMYNAVLD